MSAKLIYVLSPFHMLFFSILYPYLCKTHNNSSKLGFVGFLMGSKWFSKKICKIFSKRELIGCLTACHLEDEFLCII